MDTKDKAFLYFMMALVLAAEGYFFGCRHPEKWPGLNVFSIIFNQGGGIPLFLILYKDVTWFDEEETL